MVLGSLVLEPAEPLRATGAPNARKRHQEKVRKRVLRSNTFAVTRRVSRRHSHQRARGHSSIRLHGAVGRTGLITSPSLLCIIH